MPKALYSAYSFLAWWVNRKYYRDLHYVWCSPTAGGRRLHGYGTANPPSSSPIGRYQQLQREAASDDRHGPLIAQNRIGISKGAELKLEAGAISQKQRDEILTIAKRAGSADFKPLLYVIPLSDEVENLLEEVPIDQRAHPRSDEYIIRELPGNLFDYWDLEDE